MVKTFHFECKLRVSLQNGEDVTVWKTVAVEASSGTEAQSHVRSIATEMCHDAGSRWFDVPVEDVEVLSSRSV